MKLGVLLVALFGINILYSVFFGGSMASVGHFMFYIAMFTWGIIRIVQAKRKQVESD